MADNSITTATQTFRTLDDGTAKWPANSLAYPTTISAGANVLQLVDGTHGLPVSHVGNVTVVGTGTFACQAVVTNAGTFAVQVSTALPAGTNGIGKLTANSGVTIGAVEIASAQTLATVTTVGTVTTITNVVHVDDNSGSLTVDNGGTFAVQPGPSTSGGLSVYSFLSTNAVQAAQIKGSAGQVYSLQFFNNSASLRYVRLYNMTGTPASTDTANIVWRGLIPASTSGAGHIVSFPHGIAFSTGIGIRVTGAIADNDTTVLTGNDVVGDVEYK